MNFDHAIVGGGIAGSSLAWRLVRHGLGSVVLVDPGAPDPRTFAFWTNRPLPFDDLVVHRWSHLRVVGHGRDLLLPLGDWRYGIVRAQALRELAVQSVVEAGGRVLRVEATAIEEQLDRAVVHLPGEESVFARWAYDSRPRPSDAAFMKQSFRGLWIDVAGDAFDPTVATLMDFRVGAESVAGALQFFHVLPVTPRRALVTGVVMAADEHEVDVEAYVRERLGLTEITVTAVERGCAALSDQRMLRRVGQRLMRIGNAGGLLKPSTGYAFMRIQDDADHVVASLKAQDHPFRVPRGRIVWRLLDGVFLHLIRRRGQATEVVLVGLFTRSSTTRVLRFLDEALPWRPLLGLIMSLPRWNWFAAAAVAWLGRRRATDPARDLTVETRPGAVEEPYRHQASSIAFAVASLALAYMMAPFIVVLFAALVLVVVTWPWFDRLAERTGRWVAASILTLAVVVVILTPLTFAGWLAVRQIIDVADAWVAFTSQGGVAAWLDQQLAMLPTEWAAWLAQIDTSVDGMLRDAFATLVNRVGPFVSGVVSAVVEGSVQAGIFIVVLWSMYVEGPTLASTLRRIVPLPDEQTVRLFVVFQQFAWNVVVGMLATSLGQGAVAALGFWLVGAERIALLGLATAVGSQVPLVGAAVVWAPIAISFAVQGRWSAAVFIAVWSLVLTASVDNVVKPFIYRHGLRVHPALVLLSLLGGMFTFGPAGLLVGPFLLVLFLALLRFHDPGATAAAPS